MRIVPVIGNRMKATAAADNPRMVKCAIGAQHDRNQQHHPMVDGTGSLCAAALALPTPGQPGFTASISSVFPIRDNGTARSGVESRTLAPPGSGICESGANRGAVEPWSESGAGTRAELTSPARMAYETVHRHAGLRLFRKRKVGGDHRAKTDPGPYHSAA